MNTAATSALSSTAIDIQPVSRRAETRGDAPDFSYALASASLERMAAQSLKAHGAAPGGDSATAKARPDPQSSTKAPRSEVSQPENQAATSPEQEVAPATNAEAPKGTAAANAAGAAPPQALIATNVPFGGPAGQHSARATDSVALRDQALRPETSKATGASKQPAQTATARADFAEVLARRLEKTSIFEMRLDPPEHGRVEGRLAIADDGKAILSLTFDNQSAFDLFSRDAQLLRQTLAQAGLDFASGDLRFSYREQPPTDGPAVADATTATIARRDYEALFHADWSAGALDIRI